jgi:plasmid stabilization system protein ParE
MTAYALSRLAKADIFHIWSYIAADNEDAADRVEEAIYEACSLVAEAPLAGHIRSDLTKRALRFWTLTRFPNYVIACRPDTSPLEIVAIIHGMRNIRNISEAAALMEVFASSR